MKKYIRALIMSMSMFCAIPCPYRAWDEESRPLMTLFLPVVGLFIGAVLILMFFTAVTALSNTGFGEKCQEAISENKVLDTIYNNNIICDVYFDLAGKIQ